MSSESGGGRPTPSPAGPAGAAGYGAAADALAEQYESVTFDQVHAPVLHLVPDRPCAVLDVGAGSGRDAAALAARGHRVVAAEPTAQLRAHGQRLHAGRGIVWVDDALPGLPVLTAGRSRFDLILLTAVWMHLDKPERTAAMGALRSLLADDGHLLMTLRHGPVPPGRRMFAVPPDETPALARAHGLSLVHESHRNDPHGRAGVTWTSLAFHAAAAPGRDR